MKNCIPWFIILNFDCKGYKNCNSEILKLCLVSEKILRENTRERK